jgi:hypothetical protein
LIIARPTPNNLKNNKIWLMKKFLFLGSFLVLLSVAVSAQQASGDRFRRHRIENGVNNRRLSRSERLELRKDEFRYKTSQRRARRDGRITPFERRRLHKMRNRGRRDLFRYRHNGRRRII